MREQQVARPGARAQLLGRYVVSRLLLARCAPHAALAWRVGARAGERLDSAAHLQVNKEIP
eukprot:4545771-Pleurochrysis_carterae.AAC.3